MTGLLKVLLGTEMASRLPGELEDLIIRHAAALTLQRSARRHLERLFSAHTKTDRWGTLSAMLGASLVSRLRNYRQVRREWLLEPESWIQELLHEPSMGAIILKECHQGLWD
jgi:hypothetical protein